MGNVAENHQVARPVNPSDSQLASASHTAIDAETSDRITRAFLLLSELPASASDTKLRSGALKELTEAGTVYAQARTSLEQALSLPHLRIIERIEIVRVLISGGPDTSSSNLICNLLRDHPEANVRLACVIGLERENESAFRRATIGALQDSDNAVRLSAALSIVGSHERRIPGSYDINSVAFEELCALLHFINRAQLQEPLAVDQKLLPGLKIQADRYGPSLCNQLINNYAPIEFRLRIQAFSLAQHLVSGRDQLRWRSSLERMSGADLADRILNRAMNIARDGLTPPVSSHDNEIHAVLVGNFFTGTTIARQMILNAYLCLSSDNEHRLPQPLIKALQHLLTSTDVSSPDFATAFLLLAKVSPDPFPPRVLERARCHPTMNEVREVARAWQDVRKVVSEALFELPQGNSLGAKATRWWLRISAWLNNDRLTNDPSRRDRTRLDRIAKGIMRHQYLPDALRNGFLEDALKLGVPGISDKAASVLGPSHEAAFQFMIVFGRDLMKSSKLVRPNVAEYLLQSKAEEARELLYSMVADFRAISSPETREVLAGFLRRELMGPAPQRATELIARMLEYPYSSDQLPVTFPHYRAIVSEQASEIPVEVRESLKQTLRLFIDGHSKSIADSHQPDVLDGARKALAHLEQVS